MSKTRIAFSAVTGLFGLMILPGAVADIVQPQMVVDAMRAIDLPMYVLTLIGVWKLLGVVALALPRFRRVNEWAYAGFFFDLTGAAFCHWAGGDPVGPIVTPLVFLVPLTASYVLRDMAPAEAGVAQPTVAAG